MGDSPRREVLNRVYVPTTEQEHLQYAQWISARVPYFNPIGVKCISIWHGEKLAIVVGYSRPHYNRVEGSWACDVPNAMTRSAIITILSPAFLPPISAMGITAVVVKKNTRSRKAIERMGFVYEGVCRKAYPDGSNLLFYGLLRDEFLALIEKYKGADERRRFMSMITLGGAH